MAFGRRKSSIYSANRKQSMPTIMNMKDYSKSGYGVFRHDYTSATLGSGTIASNSYIPIPLLQFKRTFGGSDDTPPTPTAGNNYQTPDVFNGSEIKNYEATVHISTRGSAPGYLTVYEAAYSFWDAYLHNAIYPTQCPVVFEDTAVAPDTRGQVTLKTPSATLISANLNKSLKFLQHYIRPVGKVFVNAINAQDGALDIKINRIPAKCRRANSGMAWYLFLHNDATDNNSLSVSADVNVEAKFDEIPTEFRLPYLS